jgi:hypothetical protein
VPNTFCDFLVSFCFCAGMDKWDRSADQEDGTPVNLPELVAHTTMDAESVSVLLDCLGDFMRRVVLPVFAPVPQLSLTAFSNRWMVKEQKHLFQKEYDSTTSAYQNLART